MQMQIKIRTLQYLVNHFNNEDVVTMTHPKPKPGRQWSTRLWFNLKFDEKAAW